MSEFLDRVFEELMEIEGAKDGKLVNDPDDPGGVTKYGFAQNYNKDIDVKTLTYEQAKVRFFNNYWKPIQCDKMPKEIAVAASYFAFHAGPEEAARKLQATCRVQIDGIVGEQTLYHLNRLKNPVNSFMSYICLKYATSRPKHRRGFFVRLFETKDAIVRILGGESGQAK